MPSEQEWDTRYETGFTPWDTGRPDPHLVRVVRDRDITPCRTLEVGCGTGTNAIWLTEQGFDVTATDLSNRAVEAARRKVEQAGATVTLIHGSFPDDFTPYDFVFDRGCLHCLDEHSERVAFAESAAARLSTEGLWLSIIGSTDGPPRDHGPPRRSAQEVVQAVEPHFEILTLEAGEMDANVPTVPRIWIALMRKRTVYT
jgi:SAM-dependent methyltransferase